MKQLAVQLPWKPEIVHLIASDDHHALERELHLGLDHCRANGEWFEINDRQLAYIRREYGGYSAAVPLP